MAINPGLSLGIQQPQVEGPMEGFKQTLALKNMLDTQAMNKQLMAQRQQEMELRDQSIEENKVKAEDLRRAQLGQKVFSDAVRAETDPDTFKTNHEGVINRLKQAGFPTIADAYEKNRDDIDKGLQDKLKTHLENTSNVLKTAANLMQPVLDAKTDQDKAAAYAGAKQQLSRMNVPPEFAGLVELPDQYTPEALGQVNNIVNSSTTVQERLNKMQTEATVKAAQAELPGKTAKSEDEVRTSQARQVLSMGKDAYIQAQAEDPDFRKAYPEPYDQGSKKAKTWMQTAGTPTAATREVNAYLNAFGDDDQMKKLGITKEDDPSEAGFYKWQQRMQGQKIVEEQQQLYGTKDQDAPMRDTPVKLKTQFASQHNKAYSDYLTSKKASDNVKNAIDEMLSGNRFAARYVPVMEAMDINSSEGIKRVNMAEILMGSNAGSAWQRLQGKIGGLVDGQPIPTDIAKDMKTVAEAVAKVSAHNYNNLTKDQNQTYSGHMPLLDETTGEPAEAKSTTSGQVSIGGKQYGVGDIAPNGKRITAVDPTGNRYKTEK